MFLTYIYTYVAVSRKTRSKQNWNYLFPSVMLCNLIWKSFANLT